VAIPLLWQRVEFGTQTSRKHSPPLQNRLAAQSVDELQATQ
jgi:hypothetical protein